MVSLGATGTQYERGEALTSWDVFAHVVTTGS